ncbi:oligosaccharide flippase family protein [Aliiglaciecola sp. SL4]|uniref:oligosaccharide flippase family protein n=1 Tax=Aliiglaciecola sp. SL4 TaxID=3239806 RepID=UPI00355B4CBA
MKLKLESSSPFWVLANYSVSKSLMAAKFFMAASFLGPELMGVAGLLLIIYAISEALTEFGLIHAIIQSDKEPLNVDLDSVWWSLSLRGACLAFFLIIFGYLYPIDEKYSCSFIVSAILIGFSALSKSMYSPNFYKAQRRRSFNKIFAHGVVGGLTDICFTVYFLISSFEVISLFIGLFSSELIKLLSSYFLFGDDTRAIARIKSPVFNIKKYVHFSKWIWLGNCNNLILNQSDKLLTGTLLGVQQLGLYQMSNRVAQLCISDVSMAFGQYLFPTFSRLNSKPKSELYTYFSRSICLMMLFAFGSATSLVFFANLLPVILGQEWQGSVLLLQILSISMSIGALISVLVAFLRAIGHPKFVTIASFFQLIVFLPSMSILGYLYGIIGIAVSTIISTATCLLTLFYLSPVPTYETFRAFRLYFKPVLGYSLVYSVIYLFKESITAIVLGIINLGVLALCTFIIEKKKNESTY